MLQLRNSSPFVPAIFALPDARGVDTLIVVVKATFDLGRPLGPAGPISLAAEQRPVTLVDEYWGEPGASSLRYPSEAHLPKPGADVIVVGHAQAPRGQAVTGLDVAVRVGERSQHARVHGDRHWTQGFSGLEPSLPQPFVRMPLIYERAYGGRLLGSSHGAQAHEEPRNPVGVGLYAGGPAAEMLGQPLPNLDDPQQPLTALGQTPTPTGFAAIAPSWQPRRSWAGTYDGRWRATRAPFLPDDFDPRFFQAASPGLRFERPLQGGEPVVLLGLHPDGRWQLALPRCELEIRARVAGESQALAPVLDTVLLEPDERRCCLLWRAALAVDERLLRVERVDVGLAALDGSREPAGAGA